jgi:quinol monooxygenase YgiN
MPTDRRFAGWAPYAEIVTPPTSITVRAELRVRPGCRDLFVDVASALAAAAAEEAGTLRYDWYTSPDPMVFVVIEEYSDAAAAQAHNQHCAEHLRRVGELAEMTSVSLHGELGPDLEGWVAASPVATAHPPLRQDARPRGQA